MRRAWAVWLAVAPGLALGAAPTAEARWGLRWQAPLECLQAADLARAVEERLGRPVFGPDAEFTLDGVLHSGTRPRWKAQLTLVDARGSVLGMREVANDEAGCPAMNASLALIVAVMIDPRAALGTPPPPEPSPPPAPVVAPVEPPPTVVVPREPLPRAEPAEAPRPGKSRGEVLIGGSGTLGLGLSASLGAELLWRVKPQDFVGVEWWLALYPRNDVTRDGGLGAVHALQTALTFCPVTAEGGPVLFTLCGGIAGTLMLTYAEGYLQGAASLLIRPDAVARARLRFGFGAFALGLGVTGAIGPYRPTMVFLKPSGASEVVPIGSWGWGAVELSVGTLWR